MKNSVILSEVKDHPKRLPTPLFFVVSVAERSGAMPTLVVGMLETRENSHMPTTSVGMVPVFFAFRNRYLLGLTSAVRFS